MWILGRQKHLVHNSFQEALNKRYQTLFKNNKRPYFILQFYLAHIVFQSVCFKNEWAISLWQTAHNLCGNCGKLTMTAQWVNNLQQSCAFIHTSAGQVPVERPMRNFVPWRPAPGQWALTEPWEMCRVTFPGYRVPSKMTWTDSQYFQLSNKCRM